jgi:hypothetical protein
MKAVISEAMNQHNNFQMLRYFSVAEPELHHFGGARAVKDPATTQNVM